MSEELIQTTPQKIGRYKYYRLGSTTLDQLKNNGIIPKKNYGELGIKKPDGLITYHKSVKAVVEYKQPNKLTSEKDLEKTINQEIQVAKILCKIFIVTDGTKSFWINSLNGERIKDEKGNDIVTVFHPSSVKNIATIEYLIDEITASISASNSAIKNAKLIDPTPLAARLWQTIWVATGKTPVKCLYNVVELFIFKFLSDLQILPDDISFNRIYEKAQNNPEEALDFYARNTRTKIYKLFPPSKEDGTSIINGTIFVNENGEANLSQSILFLRSLEHLQKYSQEFGSLTRIDKQFKTKLYESFLKQEVEALGQYFTPRKIIQSIIRMSGTDEPGFQYIGKRICDPFCGVGGFPLELLNMNEGMRSCYIPNDDGKIEPGFVLNGFDKGFERDDERTIILAKANMLIYLAELLFANPKFSTEFARIFNSTFKLFKDNLGTFGHIIKEEEDKYDYIFSNPPYVTSGSGIIKEELQKTPRTINEYPINALGLEGLSLEWIIKSLKKGGKAFLIIPDGILGRIGGMKLRNYILSACYLDAIVSLPVRTFFPNFEHTYILAITKKNNINSVQQYPVFTYLVSNIGEKLTSVKREEIDEDDLPEMENLFGIYTASKEMSKSIIEKSSGRCKIQDISLFQNSSHWVIDRWWNRKERVELKIEEANNLAKKNEVDNTVKEFNSALEEYENFISKQSYDSNENMEINLGDISYFKIFIGGRVLRKDLENSTGEIPLYSANVFKPFGFVKESNIDNFDYPSILWAIDGNFEFNLIPAKVKFSTTDHCGTIQILNPEIVLEYLLYALNLRREEESFDRSFRASLANMRKFVVSIPKKSDGTIDIKAQKKISSYYMGSKQKKEELARVKKKLDLMFDRYVLSN